MYTSTLSSFRFGAERSTRAQPHEATPYEVVEDVTVEQQGSREHGKQCRFAALHAASARASTRAQGDIHVHAHGRAGTQERELSEQKIGGHRSCLS